MHDSPAVPSVQRRRSARSGETFGPPGTRAGPARARPPDSPSSRSPSPSPRCPLKDGCRSPKKLIARPSGAYRHQHLPPTAGLETSARVSPAIRPDSSTARNHLPSIQPHVVLGSSRPSTVFGCVPGRHQNRFRAGRRHRAYPVASSACWWPRQRPAAAASRSAIGVAEPIRLHFLGAPEALGASRMPSCNRRAPLPRD